jgi:hypothetical protein
VTFALQKIPRGRWTVETKAKEGRLTAPIRLAIPINSLMKSQWRKEKKNTAVHSVQTLSARADGHI